MPDIDERFGEGVHERVVVIRSRSNPQPLRSARHSGVIDRLDVDPVPAQQQIARYLALLRVPDQKRARAAEPCCGLGVPDLRGDARVGADPT